MMSSEKHRCPDHALCQRNCAPDNCFRVAYADPLSGTYPNNLWPEHLKFDQKIHDSHADMHNHEF